MKKCYYVTIIFFFRLKNKVNIWCNITPREKKTQQKWYENDDLKIDSSSMAWWQRWAFGCTIFRNVSWGHKKGGDWSSAPISRTPRIYLSFIVRFQIKECQLIETNSECLSTNCDMEKCHFGLSFFFEEIILFSKIISINSIISIIMVCMLDEVLKWFSNSI